MTIPYTFANATGTLPLLELDANFESVYQYVLTAGNVVNNAQANITSVGVLNSLSVSGNISAIGNVSGNYILGNGAFLTGMYGNSDVANYLPVNPTILTIQNNIIAVNANVANTDGNLSALANTVANLTVSTGNIDLALANTNSNVANTNSNVANLTTSLTNTNSNVANTNSNVANNASNITILQGNVVTLTADLSNTNSNLANTDSNVANNASNIAILQGNVVTLTTRLASTNSNVANLTSDLSNTDSNVANLTSGLVNTNSNVANNASNIAILQGNVANLTSDLANTNSNVANNAGNITTLQGLVYSNSNVTTFLANTTIAISTTGNISADYFIGNGALLSGLPVQYTNANVTTFLADFGNNIISTSGNITAGDINATGNLSTAGNVIASGAVRTNLLNNTGGNQRVVIDPDNTGIGYIKVPAFDSGGERVEISNQFANSSGIYFYTEGANTFRMYQDQFGFPDGTWQNTAFNGSLIGANTVSITGDINTTANVTANYFIGDGSLLTNINAGNITGAYGNSNVINLLSNFGNNTISTSGDITGGTFNGGMQFTANTITSTSNTVTLTAANVVVSGNLQVLGTTTTVNVANVNVSNAVVVVSEGALTPSQANSSGIQVAANNYASILWTDLTDTWLISGNLSTPGNVVGANLIGNGSQITGIPYSSIVGAYSNANVEAYLPTSNVIISITGDVANNAGNITTLQGNVVTLTTNLANTNSNVANLTSDLANTNSNVANNAGNITTLQGNVVTLTTDLANTNSNVANINSNIGNISTDLANTNSNVANNASNITTLQGNVITLTNDLANTNSNVTALQGNVANLTNDLANTNSNIGNITTDLANTNSNVANNASNITTLQGNVVTLTNNLANTNSNVANNASNITTLQGNVANLTSDLANTNSNVANIANAVISLTGNAYGNANVAEYLPTYTGNLAGSNLSISNNAIIYGNLSVAGNITYQDSNAISTDNLFVQLANNTANINEVNGAGLVVGQGNLVTFIYSVPGNSWHSDVGFSAAGNIFGNVFIGDGSGLSNINAGNIVGSYSNANVEAYLPTSNIIIGINSNVANTNSNVANLTTDLANTNSNVANLTNDLANTNSNVANNASNITTLQGNVVTLTNNLANTNSNVANLTTDLANTNSNVANTNSNVSTLQGNVANLTSDLANTNSNVANNASNITTLQGNVANLTSDLANTNSNVANNAGNITTLQGNVTSLFGLVYNNTNVSNFMASFGSNSISTSGNITAGYFIGDGSLLTNMPVGNLIANGDSVVSIPDLSGNVIVTARNASWTFDTDNRLVFPRDSSNTSTDPYLSIRGGSDPNIVSTDPSLAGPANLSIVSNFAKFSGSNGNTVSIFANDGEIIGTSNIQIWTNDADQANAKSWTFGNDGNLTIPGDIIGTTTIDIDNRATGNSADINLYSADDITLQARDRTLGSTSEGGDINIFAGDSAEDSDTSAGDVVIEGGNGGASNLDFGGAGGTIRIQTGRGGDASTGVGDYGASSGGLLTLRAGDAGSNMGNIARGANGGNVVIEAGDSTGNLDIGGSINLVTGAGGPNGAAGAVIIDIPASDQGAGGEWIFNANGSLKVAGDIVTQSVGFPFTGPITGITTGNPTVIVTLGNSPFSGSNTGKVLIQDVVGTTEANEVWFFQSTGANEFQLFADAALTTPVDGTTWTAYVSGGTAYASAFDSLAIVTGGLQVVAGPSSWSFGMDGNIVLPSDTSSINYANGTPYGGTAEFNLQYEVEPFVANTITGFGEIQFANLEGSNSAPATAQKLFISEGALNEQGLGTVFQQWAQNSYRGTLTLNNGSDEATFNISQGRVYYEPEVYRGFQAGLNQIWGDDCSINQLIITNATAPTFYNTEFLVENDVFNASNLATGNTHVMLNVYGSSQYNPINPADLWNLFTRFVDNVLYDDVTLRTDTNNIKGQFYNNTGNFRGEIPAADLFQYFRFTQSSGADYFGTAPTTTVGQGTGATLRVRVNPNNTYAVLGVAAAGVGYQAGDQLVVLGTDLGGATPDNDLTVGVTSTTIEGNITEVSFLSGTSVYPWPSNRINDGGDDQYDTGNYLNTNLASQISYANGMPQTASAAFGGGDYCVMYDQSFFCMVATGVSSSVTNLFYSGNLGFDGDGFLNWTGLRSPQNIVANNSARYAYFDSDYLDGTLTIADGVTYNMTLDSAGIDLDGFYAYYDNNLNDYFFGNNETWRLESQQNLYVQSYADMFIQTLVNQNGTGESGPNINIDASRGSLGQREINAQAGNGGTVNVRGGAAGSSDGIDSLGNNGGGVVIEGGAGTGNSSGGTVFVRGGTTDNGSAGNVAITTYSGLAGNGQVTITTTNGTDRNWTFDATGNLILPENGNIINRVGSDLYVKTIDNNTGLDNSSLEMSPNNTLTRVEQWGSQQAETFNNSDWSSATYTVEAGLGAIQLTDAANIISFLNTLNGVGQIRLGVDGGPQLIWDGTSSGGTNITFYTPTLPLNDPTPVSSFTYYYSYKSGFEIDYDSDEVNIYANDADINLQTTGQRDISLNSSRNVTLQSGGNVSIVANINSTWTFDSTSNLTLPLGGSIYSIGSTPTGSPGNTIVLQPAGSGISTNQKLLVYPTANDGDHLHLTTGDLYQTEMFLGSDNLYVKLANTGNVVINSNDNTGNTAQWTFDTNGVLSLPGEGVLQSTNDTITLRSFNTTTGNANIVYLGTSGGLGFSDTEIGSNWLEIFRSGTEPQIGTTVGNLLIQTSSNATPYNWNFGSTGKLTLPTISLGDGLDEQTVVQSQRRIIPPFRQSAVINGDTPTVVYTASSVQINSMKVTLQVQHSGLGFELFDVSATYIGSTDTYYTISNRVAPPTIDESTVVVDLNGSNIMQITITINSGATTSWVTYDALEFGIPND